MLSLLEVNCPTIPQITLEILRIEVNTNKSYSFAIFSVRFQAKLTALSYFFFHKFHVVLEVEILTALLHLHALVHRVLLK